MSIQQRFTVQCDVCGILHRLFWMDGEAAEQFALRAGWILDDGHHLCSGCQESKADLEKEKINASH